MGRQTQTRASLQESATPILGSYEPPHNIEAEQSTLGSMLIDGEAAELGIEILRREDFYRLTHQTIYDVIGSLLTRNQPVDLITVQAALRDMEKLDEIGGMSYLTSLFDTVPTAACLPHYAEIVKRKSIAREIINTGLALVGIGRFEAENIDEAIDRSEQLVYKIRRDSAGQIGFDIETLSGELYDLSNNNSNDDGTLLGLASGYPELDRFTHGIRKKKLIVIGARPSVGKTSLATGLALHIADKIREPVLFISIEMGAEDIGLRCMSSLVRIDSNRLLSGKLSQDEWERYYQVVTKMQGVPLRIVTEVDTVSEIRAVTRRFIKEYGRCGLVIVDYLQLMASTGKIENRNQEVGEYAKGLKKMAKQLDTTVCVLSQLTRVAETKEPTKADLRESGDIEAVADLILLLHRPRIGKGDIIPPVEPTVVIVDKNRDGPKGRFTLGFVSETATYVSPAFNLIPPSEKTGY